MRTRKQITAPTRERVPAQKRTSAARLRLRGSRALAFSFPASCVLAWAILLIRPHTSLAENWPRWRGPDGNAVSAETNIPVHWSTTDNVRWKTPIAGEGASSPVVWNDRVFVTAAIDHGVERFVHCLDARSGRIVWTRGIEDDDPELSLGITGHAAATPVTDGQRVVAFFGNAGAVCYDFAGNLQWQRDLGQFESELGLASSPVLYSGAVIQVCDHDGDRFGTFDSYLVSLDVKTGQTRWKTQRPGLFRSWSTPIIVQPRGEPPQLIVNAQDELRSYDPVTGQKQWFVTGMTGWVTPSPVFGEGLIFATSGKDGPTLAIRPGGSGDVTESHVAWRRDRGAPYVCSPLYDHGLLYVHDEAGRLTCLHAGDGSVAFQQRLEGKFVGSAVAIDGRIYLSNDQGVTYILAAGDKFELLGRNNLEEEMLASPAVSAGCLYLRTQSHLYCIAAEPVASDPSPRR